MSFCFKFGIRRPAAVAGCHRSARNGLVQKIDWRYFRYRVNGNAISILRLFNQPGHNIQARLFSTLF